ncbi:cyclase family protein [Nocardia fusca]|uniref:cyclase family protein n=1 Tax=Nocardia fusca TaxID=941183 RepID=UPI0007A73BE7|nr:cyclase family protein [Nocardia fusca]
MDSLNDFYRIAEQVRNWGRWGQADELGTLNLIDEEHVRRAASLVRSGRVFSLGMDFGPASPQGALDFRPKPMHMMTVDGGDQTHYAEYGSKWPTNGVAQQIAGFFGVSPFRFNDDVIVMPLQASTQWDALSHAYYDGKLYNGFPAESVTSAGAFHCGIDKVDVKGVISRGVLIDMARYRGVEYLAPGNDITPDELDDALKRQGVSVDPGDIVLVRTGWISKFRETGDPMEPSAGLGWRCASWLHEHEVAAVAADNVMVESLESGVEGMFLPLHLLALREMGMMLGEFWNMEQLAADCASDRIYEFQIIAPPLRVTGAVGSPVNPIALK